jgi:glycosyltransferase involved in cell wall biosynthesis
MTKRDARRRVCVWREELLPGSETFILNQARALRRWSPALSGVRKRPSTLAMTADFTIQGNPGLTHRLDRRLYWNVGTSVRLHRHLCSTSLVHAHFGPDGARIARAARLARRPLIVTFHGYDVTMPDLGVDYSALFRQAARILAVSNFIRGKLLDAGAPEDKITIAPIGIPLRPDSRRGAGGEHLLFVGRLIDLKGCADVLEALSGTDHAPPLLVIGDGPLRRDLERHAESLRVKARFVGARDPAYVAEAMASAIALCVPSKSEGLPTVCLEAAAARLPVVGYPAGGIPEAVVDGETGLLAPQGDVKVLAQHLRTITDRPELAVRLGSGGRRRVEMHFDIASRTAELERVYDQIGLGDSAPVV